MCIEVPFPRHRRDLDGADEVEAERQVAEDWLRGQDRALSEVFLAEGRNELPVEDFPVWRHAQEGRLGKARSGWVAALSEAGWEMDGTQSLAYLRPDLLTEYDSEHEENPGHLPFEGTLRSTLSVWWRCHRDEDHRWRTSINNRARVGTGCPRCAKKGCSRREQDIFVALRERLPGVQSPASVPRSTRSEGGRRQRAWRVDMYLPGTPPVVVEYDGAYWHQGRHDKDAGKTADLTASGHVVLRLREHPLPTITPNDLVCATDLSAPAVAEMAHRRIEELTPDNPARRGAAEPEQLTLPPPNLPAQRTSATPASADSAQTLQARLSREALLAMHATQVRLDLAFGIRSTQQVATQGMAVLGLDLGETKALLKATIWAIETAQGTPE